MDTVQMPECWEHPLEELSWCPKGQGLVYNGSVYNETLRYESAFVAASKVPCTHEGMWKYIMLHDTSRQH